MTYSSKKILKEGLDHLDMVGQIKPILSIDEYESKMGDDSDVVTLSLVVNSKLVGEDLVMWFEKGYDFVLDASVSNGEISPGKYLVFVELERRTSIPDKIITLLKDLETLTDFSLSDWKLKISREEYSVSVENIRENLILNPNRYRMEQERLQELNEMRDIIGLPSKPVKYDSLIRDFVNSSFPK